MHDQLLRLVENGSADDSLEARIRYNMLEIQVEVEDRRERSAYVRANFMPTKEQAESLGLLLLEWARA